MMLWIWIFTTIAFVVNAFFLLPSVMALGGMDIKSQKPLQNTLSAVAYLFLKSNLLYPVIYIVGLHLYFIWKNNVIICCLPFYVLLQILLFLTWRYLENKNLKNTKS